MKYKAFKEQIAFHKSKARIRGLFAGKRGGKTEAGAVECVIRAQQKNGYVDNGVDPYLGVIIAPTTDMLRRLSLAKFFAYARPFNYKYHQTHQEVCWPNGTKIYGVSADKPQRLEGLKANWIWIDEVFQVSEQLFLECLARTADSKGDMWCTGSLGTQYVNPKQHFIYQYFKERPLPDSECFEWATLDNPYFPKDELERLKDTLDPRTFRQMFEIDWNTVPHAAVYNDFTNDNIMKNIPYCKDLEISVTIDWGWAHEMACLFTAYDKRQDVVYVFDEIVSSRMTLEQLWDKIQAKGYKIDHWFCDIAGKQEREQTGRSNVQWFRESPRNVHFRSRASSINYGISVVRRYIKNGMGQRKLYVCENKCPKTIDGMRNYAYQERDGQIINENPIKKNDDAVDALRYYFVNHLDKDIQKPSFGNLQRWGDNQWQTI